MTHWEIRIAAAAQRDLGEILEWSNREFGAEAAIRYEALLSVAILELAEDPNRAGVRARPELGEGIQTYHLHSSRNRGRSALGIVRRPRHFLIFRAMEGRVVEVVRVLHDARELSRHVPGVEPARD